MKYILDEISNRRSRFVTHHSLCSPNLLVQ